MARIPVRTTDPTYVTLTHDPIFFGQVRGVGACLHCGALVDERTRKERCLRCEDYVDWSGNLFRPDGTH